jgi:hypothetical protein
MKPFHYSGGSIMAKINSYGFNKEEFSIRVAEYYSKKGEAPTYWIEITYGSDQVSFWPSKAESVESMIKKLHSLELPKQPEPCYEQHVELGGEG